MRNRMEVLWAPWRYKYIVEEKSEGCILCEAIKSKKDAPNLILYRGKYSFIILNKYPYNNGHLMVCPYRHSGNIGDLTKKESMDFFQLLRISVSILKESYKPQGFNIGMNLGRASGAGIEEHIHFHVVPRWNGDTNFMPVFSNTRVMPETLVNTYQKLKKNLNKFLRNSIKDNKPR